MQLLDIVATPGGRAVPDELKERILAREQAGPNDPRYRADFELEGQRGFFAHGAHAAIQWDQVARITQLRVR